MLATSGGGGPDAGSWIPVLVGLLTAVAGGGGITALILSGRTGSKILVDAAQGAVVVQTGVIDDLREQLADARKEIAELRGHMAEVSALRRKLAVAEQDNAVLKDRQRQLEQENEELRARVSRLEHPPQEGIQP